MTLGTPGQPQPNPKPCAAVTSTGKLLLQLLLPLSSPNHTISWFSRPQCVPICQEGCTSLHFGHTVTTKCRISYQKSANSDVHKAKNSHIQLKRKVVASLNCTMLTSLYMKLPLCSSITMHRSQSKES